MTAKVPGAVQVLVGRAPVPFVVVPDPANVHVYTSELVFSSVDPRPSKEHTFWLHE